MKTLELNQMEVVEGGWSQETACGVSTMVATLSIGTGVGFVVALGVAAFLCA